MSLEAALRLALYLAALLSGLALGAGLLVGFGTKRGTKKGMNAALTVLFVFVAIDVALIMGTRPLALKYDVQVATWFVSGNAVGIVARFTAGALLFALACGLSFGRRKQAQQNPWGGLTIPAGVCCLAWLSIVFSVNQTIMLGAKELGIGQSKPKEQLNANQGSADNLKSLYTAFAMYAQDWDALPPAKDWMSNEEIVSKVQKDEWLHNPAVSNRTDDKFGYAYNQNIAEKQLNGKPLKDQLDAATTPFLYESSKTAKSAFDAFESASGLVLYLDGTVKPK